MGPGGQAFCEGIEDEPGMFLKEDVSLGDYVSRQPSESTTVVAV
jgi:hypothetical protein